MDYKHTCDTIFTHFQGITNNIYGFGRHFFAPSFFYPSIIFLPVHIRFYPSKCWVDGSLHKAMVVTRKGIWLECPSAWMPQSQCPYCLVVMQLGLTLEFDFELSREWDLKMYRSNNVRESACHPPTTCNCNTSLTVAVKWTAMNIKCL